MTTYDVTKTEGKGHIKLRMKVRRVLPSPERVNERLAHEKPNGDTNCDGNHGTADVYAAARCCEISSLRKAGLCNNEAQ